MTHKNRVGHMERTMKTGISRRAVLNGIGQSAALGSLAAMLPGELLAAQPARTAPAAAPKAPAVAQPPVCLTMLYPAGEGLTFDADAFRDRHIGVLKTAYAGGVGRIELRVPPPHVEGRNPDPVLAAVNIYITDFTKFAAGANARAKDVSASMASITRSAPIAQFDYILGGIGAGPETVQPSANCVTYWFEAKEGATFDSKGFAEVHAPKVAAAYGPSVRRIEVAKGEQSANGSKPLMLGSVSLYIADEAGYDAAVASEAVKTVSAESAQYFSLAPIQTLMVVHAVG
jgi:hypothetical protein